MKVFNINDYLITRTSTIGEIKNNPTIDVEVTIDEEKIKEDIELFKIILESLEKLIGPYTIKVNSKNKNKKKKDKEKICVDAEGCKSQERNGIK